MAAARAQEASPPMSRGAYHVFLSFRGEDTRYSFTDHLYTALKYAGLHIFRDDDGIERGGNIPCEIERAICDSELSIIVFSKNYASSEWCLDELAMIMEHRRTVGHVVVPVFYHVHPSEVLEQCRNILSAFANHRSVNDIERVKEWRGALKEVTDLAGEVLKEGYEAQFIQDIVKKVSNKLNRAILHIPSYLVGVDSRVRDINIWLGDWSNCASIGVIYGIGGVGKTTIAKMVYNMNFDKFEGKSFLANVREISNQPNGLVKLQRQVLSDLLKGRTNKVHNVDEGIMSIKDAIQHKRVLIVLDDVDQLHQFNAIIGMRYWLHQGSKIIITTRHERLLKAHEVCKMFKIEELDDNKSLQLFSWHAFGQLHPSKEYIEHSISVVQHCGGLPLALEILGSCLSGRSFDIWKRAVQEPEAIDDGKIQRILRISFDSLEDDRDKNLLLDVACFFLEKDKDCVDKVLDSCDFYRVLGIQNLIDRCLVTINEHNKLTMHHSLRDMARQIVRQESPEEVGKRSRIWRYEDAFAVLRENIGTKTIRSLTFSHHPMCKASSKKMDLKTKAFTKMRKLKLLQLNYAVLTGDYKNFPQSLIWLSYHGFPLASIPSDFDLEKLVVLDMRNSSLQQAWEGTKSLPKLKILNLSHSHFLVRTPDFTGVTSLERLMLKDCISLAEVDESVEVLKRLVFFSLENCKKLKRLSSKIGTLKSLETLILSGCSELDKLPKALAEMGSLQVLLADRIDINQFQFTIGIRDKVSLSLLTFLPCFLVKLSLTNCNIQNGVVPNNIGNLASLRYLNLSGNLFSTLPESMNSLTLLDSLMLEECIELQSLPQLPESIEQLNLKDCSSLERITNLPNLLTSLRLNLLGCKNLVEVQGLFKLEPITDIHAVMINGFRLFDLISLGFLHENGRTKYAETKRHISVLLRNDMTVTHKKTEMQVLNEFGIFSIFFHGSEVPHWYSYQNMGPEISFTVPPILNRYAKGLCDNITCGLNLCVVYQLSGRDFEEEAFRNSPYAIIRNETKGLKWIYSPMFYQERYASDSLVESWRIYGPSLWLSHWKFGVGDQLEAGDHVTVSVSMSNGFCVEKCGIHVVDELEEEYQSLMRQLGESSRIMCKLSYFKKFNCVSMNELQEKCNQTFGRLVNQWEKCIHLSYRLPTESVVKDLRKEGEEMNERLMVQLEEYQSLTDKLRIRRIESLELSEQEEEESLLEEYHRLRRELKFIKGRSKLKEDCLKVWGNVDKMWQRRRSLVKELHFRRNISFASTLQEKANKTYLSIISKLDMLQTLINKLEQEGNKTNSIDPNPWRRTLGNADVSAYQVAPQVYFLCHWENKVHQQISRYGLDKLSQYHRLYVEINRQQQATGSHGAC